MDLIIDAQGLFKSIWIAWLARTFVWIGSKLPQTISHHFFIDVTILCFMGMARSDTIAQFV